MGAPPDGGIAPGVIRELESRGKVAINAVEAAAQYYSPYNLDNASEKTRWFWNYVKANVPRGHILYQTFGRAYTNLNDGIREAYQRHVPLPASVWNEWKEGWVLVKRLVAELAETAGAAARKAALPLGMIAVAVIGFFVLKGMAVKKVAGLAKG